MKHITLILGFLILATTILAQEKMMYGDTSRKGVPFSKDPHVIKFDNGKTWFISNVEVFWNEDGAYLKN